MEHASQADSTIQFEPVPYRADGSITFGSALQMVGLLGLAGMLLGAMAGLISQYIYIVLMFPIAIGLGVGAIGSWCVRKFHVRNPLLCGAAGFFAGCLAMLAMHYTEYRRFDERLAVELGDEGKAVQQIALRMDEIKADWDNASEDDRAVITELEKNPDGLRALRANTLWRYIDMMAHNGVELKRGGGNGLNLGYTGSYIYWGIETLIVAGMAYTIMSGAASEPYCSNCGNWKGGQLFGPFANSQQIVGIIRDGNLSHFAKQPEGGQLDTMVTLYSCPACQGESETDVRVERWTVNGKGETNKKKLVQMTYPSEAHPVLVAVCTPIQPVVEVNEPSEPEPAEQDSPGTNTEQTA